MTRAGNFYRYTETSLTMNKETPEQELIRLRHELLQNKGYLWHSHDSIARLEAENNKLKLKLDNIAKAYAVLEMAVKGDL